ncbi:hypothetical protein [Methyloversatilis universalis]|uniref:hypothetical protein n=1 Tax=Methyloversatilis universalis TaxID=378211 RepID=UPI0012FAD92E|nr:hypothetical protein [Methyloversatilis universalis]
MRNFETDNPSIFERCFAAAFSGVAAGATYATLLFFHTGTWGAEQVEAFKDIGKWIVLAGAVVGFLGGISLVVWIWGEIWDTSSQPLFSLRTAVALLALSAIAYGIFMHMPK